MAMAGGAGGRARFGAAACPMQPGYFFGLLNFRMN